MASFTDAISQFNPYVTQLPVDAMSKVGMQKQAQYEQGVQKIQSQVDQVTGINVSRSVDKQYLESKLGQLNNNLRLIAGGDFSSQQLVNSVGGMSKEISSDKKIQNAVASTNNIYKQSQIMENARQKGELAPENEDLYNEHLSKYLYSTEEDASFTNGRYIPYTNVFKKLQEAAAAVGIDSQDISQIFQTDARGNPISDGKGGFKWNPIMATEKLKGKDIGKVLSMFKSSLTPQDYQQLSITGRYTYKNASTEELAKMIESDYTSDRSKITALVDDIRVKLVTEESSQNPNKEKLTDLAEQYKHYNELSDNLEKSISSEIDNMIKNPDVSKGSLYTRKYLNTMAVNMSGIEKSKSYSVNPNFTILEANRNFAFAQEKERNDNIWRTKEFNYKVEKDKNDSYQKLVESYQKGEGPLPPGYLPKAIVAPFDITGGEAYSIVNQKQTEYDNAVANTNNAANVLTEALFKNANPIKPGEKIEAYNKRIKNQVDNIVQQKHGIMNINSGEINKITHDFALEIVAKWKKGGNIPVQFKSVVSQYYENLKEETTLRGQMQAYEKKAIERAKLDGANVMSDAEVKKAIKPVKLNVYNNSTRLPSEVTLSPSDVMDWAMINADRFNFFGSLTMDKSQEANKQAAILRQQAKLGNKFNDVSNSVIIDNLNNLTTHLNPDIKKAGELMNKAGVDKKTKYLAELYQQDGFVSQPVMFPVKRGKENKDDVDASLVTMVDKYSDVSSNAEKIKAAIVATGSSVGFKVIPKGAGMGNDYQMIVNDAKGNKEILPIEESDYIYMFGNAPRSNNVPKVINQVNAMGTSNLSGTNDHNTAWWDNDKFTKYSNPNFGLSGDLIPDRIDKNKLWFIINQYDKKTGEFKREITYPTPFDKLTNGQINNQLDYLPTAINNAVLEGILNNQ